MEEVLELVRRIGRQQCHNAYYRTCYSLLKELQKRIEQILQRLVRSHMGDPVPMLNLHTLTAIAIDLHHAAITLRSRQEKAGLVWKGMC